MSNPSDLTARIARLESQVAELQRQRFGVDPARIEDLLSAIHRVFESNPFSAVDLIEFSVDPNVSGSADLFRSIAAACPRPSARKLSHLLSRSTVTVGEWQLSVFADHSRAGRLFAVTKVRNFVTTSARPMV